MTVRKARQRARGGGRAHSTASARRSAASHQSRPSQWLYGIHTVGAALANPTRRCHRLVAVSAELARSGNWQAEIVSREALAALLPEGAVHQGVAVLVDPLPELDLATLCTRTAEDTIVVVLDQVTDPHNVGAIMRSAAAFGAAALIMAHRRAPTVTGVLAKAAAGALERLPLVRVGNLAMALEQLKRSQFWCLGLDPAGDIALGEAPTTGRRALVLGAEGQGLRRLTRESCDHLVRIPMADDAESLNVSNAAAVALYALVGGWQHD